MPAILKLAPKEMYALAISTKLTSTRSRMDCPPCAATQTMASPRHVGVMELVSPLSRVWRQECTSLYTAPGHIIGSRRALAAGLSARVMQEAPSARFRRRSRWAASCSAMNASRRRIRSSQLGKLGKLSLPRRRGGAEQITKSPQKAARVVGRGAAFGGRGCAGRRGACTS
jgi:hypothetical protein